MNDDTTERWLPVPGYEGLYEVICTREYHREYQRGLRERRKRGEAA